MRPSIIFFDEIDGLAPVRSSRQDQIHRWDHLYWPLFEKQQMHICAGTTTVSATSLAPATNIITVYKHKRSFFWCVCILVCLRVCLCVDNTTNFSTHSNPQQSMAHLHNTLPPSPFEEAAAPVLTLLKVVLQRQAPYPPTVRALRAPPLCHC